MPTFETGKAFTRADLVRYTIVIALLIFFLFPIYWMIATSFKPPLDILTRPPKWSAAQA